MVSGVVTRARTMSGHQRGPSSSSSGSVLNPLVLRVLKDHIASSRQRKAKSYAVLCRAYRSLRACPLTFTALPQLQQLDGFESQALLKTIELWLQQLCDEQGRGALPVEFTMGMSIPSSSHQIQRMLGEDAIAATDINASANLQMHQALKLASGVPRGGAKAAVTTKSRREREPKLYTPKPRTGAYGILVALFALTAACPQEAEGSTPLSRHAKATIIGIAQAYSDAKYLPKAASAGFGRGSMDFYSAWSTMKTLINRGYVYRTGNPARFSLSHLGWQVAKTCAEQENVGCGSRENQIGQEGEEASKGPDANSLAEHGVHAASRRPEASREEVDATEPFLYSYVTDELVPKLTLDRATAAVRLSDLDYRAQYRIAFQSSSQTHSIVTSCVMDVGKTSIGGATLCTGYIKAASCNERAPGIQMAVSAPLQRSLLDRIDAEMASDRAMPSGSRPKGPTVRGERAQSRSSDQQGKGKISKHTRTEDSQVSSKRVKATKQLSTRSPLGSIIPEQEPGNRNLPSLDADATRPDSRDDTMHKVPQTIEIISSDVEVLDFSEISFHAQPQSPLARLRYR